jgi:hypothetical protein
VPQDIHSTSHAKKTAVESEYPKVDKSSSPLTGKSTSKMLKPPDPEDTKEPASAKSVPTTPSDAILGRGAAHQFPRPEPTEHHEASPRSPKSFGLRAPGGRQPIEGSSVPRSEEQPCQYSCVAESPWDNLDFIQAEVHNGRYISASVNTKTEREQIKVLYSSMKTTSELIDVSIFTSPYLFILKFESSLIQAMVKHSQDKDQFLKVS